MTMNLLSKSDIMQRAYGPHWLDAMLFVGVSDHHTCSASEYRHVKNLSILMRKLYYKADADSISAGVTCLRDFSEKFCGFRVNFSLDFSEKFPELFSENFRKNFSGT
jgi:hypothetical protein